MSISGNTDNISLRKSLLLIFFILTIAALIIAYIFSTKREIEPVESKEDLRVPVTVMRLKKHPFRREINIMGNAFPRHKALVRSEVSGVVVYTAPKAEPGRKVKKDDPLIRIDDRAFRISLDIEEANVRRAEAELELQKLDNRLQNKRFEQIKTELSTAEKELNRKKDLLTQMIISRSEYNREEALYAGIKEQYLAQLYRVQSSEGLLKKSEASFAAAIARRDMEKLNLDKTTISAPFSGVVQRRHVDRGTFVSQKDLLFEIIDYSTIVIKTGIAASKIDFINKGVEVSVHSPYSDGAIRGELKYVAPEADMETRLFAAEIYIDNNDPSVPVMAGIFLNIHVRELEPETSFVVPFSAVTEDGKGRCVFIVKTINSVEIVEKVYVDVSWEQDGYTVIEGVEESDFLVTKGHENLTEKALVKIIEITNR